MTHRPVPIRHQFAYAMPAFSTTMLILPTFTVLPAFYVKYTAMTLAQVGMVLLIARIFDAITDPLIGLLSERTSSRFGKRKPWMMAGAIFCMGFAYLLFSPSQNADVAYFLACSLLLYLGWTMIEIPYSAWGAELTKDYSERTQIVTFRMMAGSLGSILFLAAPLFLGIETQEFTPDVMTTIGLTVALLLPLTVLVAVVVVPTGRPAIETSKPQLRLLYRSILRNRIFWRFILAFVLASIAGGIYNGLMFLFIDSYLGIGSSYSYIAIVLLVTSWLSLPLWTKAMKRIGKHKGWLWGALFASLITPLLAFVEPGSGSLSMLLPLVALIAVGWAANMVAPYSIMADIIDYDELKSGVSQASNYFAVFSFLTKSCVAIGGGIAFIALGLVGYEVNEPNSAFAQTGFLVIMLGLPLLFNLGMVATLWRFPLDERRQKIIQRRLSARRHP